MAEKADFKKLMKALYGPTVKQGLHLVEVPPMRFLMIDGVGDPNTSVDYSDAVETLYPVAYALKFASKAELGQDYTVPPLEGLWWADDMSSFVTGDKSKWRWSMMLMVPDWISPAMIDAAVAKVAQKGPGRGGPVAEVSGAYKALRKLRVEVLAEGKAVQVLHIGPYHEEGPLLAKMHNEFIPAHGLTMTGKHHEIYLSDPRRVAPEKLNTILRQPVR